MKIRFGYELVYASPQNTPMILLVNAQPSATQRLLIPDWLRTEPAIDLNQFRDLYGNPCIRLDAPTGIIRITTDALLEDSGVPEPAFPSAREYSVGELPQEVLTYLLPSRYCESDLLAYDAQRLFGHMAPGWSRVQAICDFVHQHVSFGYPYARCTKTALETYRERQGVCRDFAHLAIALCRSLNIPARYTSNYLGDIGVPVVDTPMDFAGGMDVYLSGTWHSFDPRNNIRRIGRLAIARGRDAADVAISTAFGPSSLQHFRVWTDEITDEQAVQFMIERLTSSSQCPAAAQAA
jgi:transglutaminase-like putative cysteine protease